MHNKPHGKALRLRVDKASPTDAFRTSEELPSGALTPYEIEPGIDLLFREAKQRFNPQSHIRRL